MSKGICTDADCIDKFQWARVMAVARYYWPRLRNQVIAYPLVSLVVFALMILLDKAGAGMLGDMLYGLTGYLVMFGAIALVTRHDFDVTTVLPAKGSEKCVFILFYALVAIPLLVYAPGNLLSLIVYGEWIFSRTLNMSDMLDLDAWVVIFSNMLSSAAAIGTCLWTIMANRRHRVVKGIIYPLFPALGFGIITGIVISLQMFTSGVVMAARASDADEVAYTMVNILTNDITYIMIPLLFIYVAFVLVMTCVTICRRAF